MATRLYALWIPVLVLLCAPGPLAAGEIMFDVTPAIAVRDVTTAEFRAVNPHEKLIEIKTEVSTFIRSGAEDELQEIVYRFDFTPRGLEITDYLPKTTLATDVVGNLGIEKKTEDCNTLGLTLTGVQHPLTGTLNGSVSDKDAHSLRYELLPPLETVAASGTLNRRSSIYFKLRPTSRISLEGDKQLVVIARVADTWRGGYVYLRCQAIGGRRTASSPFETTDHLGSETFVLAMYLEGDAEAQQAAREFSHAELRLRQAAKFEHRQSDKRSLPTLIHKVGALLTVVDRKIPDDWLPHVLYAAPGAAPEQLLEQLPAGVQREATSYLNAKRRLAMLK